jgi:hypothetical protein
MGQFDSGDDWVRRSQRVCDDDLMRAIVGDSRHSLAPRSAIPEAPRKTEEEPKPYRHGWVDPAPLPRPAGIEHVDRLVDQQDRIDAAARARQLGLSHEEWARLSEKDIANHKAQQAKKAEAKK